MVSLLNATGPSVFWPYSYLASSPRVLKNDSFIISCSPDPARRTCSQKIASWLYANARFYGFNDVCNPYACSLHSSRSLSNSAASRVVARQHEIRGTPITVEMEQALQAVREDCGQGTLSTVARGRGRGRRRRGGALAPTFARSRLPPQMDDTPVSYQPHELPSDSLEPLPFTSLPAVLPFCRTSTL